MEELSVPGPDLAEVRARYEAAVDSFVEKVKGDQNVIAVVVAGSLAYDTVWEKSDVDMTLVVRDQTLDITEFCIDEDEIVLNAALMTRTEFKRGLERSKGGGIAHSFMAKGRVVYSTDDTIGTSLEAARRIGAEDMELSLLHSSVELISLMHKIMKWVYVKNDLQYAQLYILKAAEVIGSMEVCAHCEPPTREAIRRAVELNPELMATFYTVPMAGPLTRGEVVSTIGAIEAYLDSRIGAISRPVTSYMADGGIRTVTMITKQLGLPSHAAIHSLEYLAEKGVIERVTQPIRLTPKGRKSVDEVAFMCISRT